MVARPRVYAVVAVLALLGAACGSRVVPLAEGPQSGEPGSKVGKEKSTPIQPVPGFTGPSGLPTGGTSIPGVGPGVQLPVNCSGGATDVGVTPTSIKLGLIASLTGPLPGQFNSAVEAVDAYFRGLNDAGGICGRKIRLLIRDDNGNGTTNFSVASKLAEEDKIFSFVGSTSAPDDSGIAKVSKKHKIPDIGFPLTWERTESPYSFGVPGQIQRRWIGEGVSGGKYLNNRFGIKQMAIFWLKESEASILNAWGFEAIMMRNLGGNLNICHEQPTGVLDNNYTNYVVSMQGNCDPADGPIAVYSTMENNANIKLAKAMKEQGFEPTFFAPTFTSYLPSFITQSGGATEGAFIAMPQIPFERLDRPQSEWTAGALELKRYLDTLKRYYPRHRAPGSFGAPGWGMAALFTQAAIACGANLTRACILQTLEAMGPFSANGFLSPARPGDHVVYTSDIIVQVKGGKFVELPRPSGHAGPAEAPDFWDGPHPLINWQKYFCANQTRFPNYQEKKELVSEC